MPEPVQIDECDIGQHIQAMRETLGFKILMQKWNEERERIIATGKSGRREEKTIKNWAVLDGFDSAVKLVYKLSLLERPKEESQEDE